MMKAVFSSVVYALVFLIVGVAYAQNVGPSNRVEEATEILSTLVTTHPRGKEIAALPEFQLLASDLKQTADQVPLAVYVEKIRQIFALANDGHTAVLSFHLTEGPYGVRLPILVEVFRSGAYVIEAKDEALPLLGARITKVASIPIQDVMNRYVESSNGDNKAFKVRWSPFLFSSPALLQGMGYLGSHHGDPIEIEAVDQGGTTITATITPRSDGNAGRIPIERKLTQIEELARHQPSYGKTHFPLFTHKMDRGRILYISLAEMGDQEDMPFASLDADVRNIIADSRLKRIVIDLRQNGGGNNMLAEPLRRALVRSRFNKPGGIYILTSRKTFSAAMNFATRMERETDAIFIGEPTGGRPNHFGDAVYTEAPVTGLPFLVSTITWQDSTPFDQRIWILPDIPAPLTFDDYLSGQDRALEAALTDRPNVAEFNDSRISAPWDRQSQLAEWKYFFETD